MVGGRFIVIVTESIALMMFLYRFSLDGRLVDLHDKVKADQAILNDFHNSEPIDRDIQDRLALAKKTMADTNTTISTVSQIVDSARGLITFTTFQMSEKSIKLAISANSLSNLNKFVSAVQAFPFVQSVKIDTIENHTSSGSLSLSLTVVLKS